MIKGVSAMHITTITSASCLLIGAGSVTSTRRPTILNALPGLHLRAKMTYRANVKMVGRLATKIDCLAVNPKE